MSKFLNFCNRIIGLIFGAIICFLFVMSIFTVCHMNSNEHTFFVKGNVLVKIILLAIIICGAYLFKKKKPYFFIKELKHEKVIKYILLAIIFAINLSWVLLVRSNAVADQFFVMDAAMKLKNGDYSMFMPGNYVSYYTVQMGLVTVHYFLAYVFGEYNYLAFQILSAVAVTFSWNSLYEIAKTMGIKSVGRVALLVMGVIFLPYSFYSTFVYGTILGFSFSIAALKYELMFIKDKKVTYIILSGLCIALGIMIKSNYLIFLVGMLIILFMWVLKSFSKKTVISALIASFIIVCLYLVQSYGVKAFIEAKTGIAMDKSMSSLAWLEMGFQDGPRAPGWYNEYNISTYFEAECDPKRQSEIVKADLENTLSEMMIHKKDSLKFLSKKVASEWLNPSFQSIWTVQQTGTELRERKSFVNNLISTAGNIRFTEIYEILEFLFLFGLFIFVLSKFAVYKEQKELGVSLLEVIFIGGFIFYLFWEAKGQYTIVYMALVSPLAIIGYSKLTKVIDYFVDKTKNKKRAVISIVTVLIIIAVGIIASRFYIHNEDDEEFSEYKEFYLGEGSDVESSAVILHPYLDLNSSLYNDGESVKCDDLYAENKVLVISSGSTSRVIFPDGRCVVGYLNTENFYNLEAGTFAENDTQMWKIKLNDDNETYTIYSPNGVALTYNNDDYFVYLIDKNDSDYQKWVIEK